MNKIISRKLFIVEIVVLLLPSIFLFLWAAVVAIATAGPVYGLVSTVASILLVGTSIYCLCYIGVIFIRKGAEAICKINSFVWVFLILGVLYTFSGLLFLGLFLADEHLILQYLTFFRFGSFGVPLLFPALHLYLESTRKIELTSC